MELASGQVNLGSHGPGGGELEMDRIERTARDVVAEDRHPFRRIGMDRDLALDQDVDTRGSRAPLKGAEFRGVFNAIDLASSRIGPACREGRPRRRAVSALVR